MININAKTKSITTEINGVAYTATYKSSEKFLRAISKIQRSEKPGTCNLSLVGLEVDAAHAAAHAAADAAAYAAADAAADKNATIIKILQSGITLLEGEMRYFKKGEKK